MIIAITYVAIGLVIASISLHNARNRLEKLYSSNRMILQKLEIFLTFVQCAITWPFTVAIGICEFVQWHFIKKGL